MQEFLLNHGIPDDFNGLPTDIVEVGQITVYQNPRDRHRPAPGGVSVGHPDTGSGTLGCLVEKNGNHYILSNNHVLATSNDAEVGDPVIQPGSGGNDGGSSPEDNIAILEPYQEIDFSRDRDNPNTIDAAIALVGDCNQEIVVPEIMGIGMPRSVPIDPDVDLRGRSVRKYGRTTEDRTGVVKAIDVLLRRVKYNVSNQERVALFDGQIEIEGDEYIPFSDKGDSGSLIVDSETREPAALLFAGEEKEGRKVTYANPINLVLQYYDVTVVGE